MYILICEGGENDLSLVFFMFILRERKKNYFSQQCGKIIVEIFNTEVILMNFLNLFLIVLF